MPRQILLLSTSVGAGHTRAAEAVELAIHELSPEDETTHVDVLSLTNAMFRRVYGTAYLDLVNKMPHALGYFYDLLDQEPSPSHRSDRLRRLVQRMNLGKFVRLLKSKPWDAVVNTHFLSADIIAGLKQKDEFPPPHATVITDFEAHRLWANQPCEQYFTASNEGSLQLHHWGVPTDATMLTGIPIHPAFSRTNDRAECQRRHGVTGDRPVILATGGRIRRGTDRADLLHDSGTKAANGVNRGFRTKCRAQNTPRPLPRSAAPSCEGPRLHHRHARVDVRRRHRRFETGRTDDLGNPRQRRRDDDRQSHPGSGESQQ